MQAGVFEDTLRNIARAAPAGRNDWWIVGSGALMLCGIDVGTIRDVDVMASRETARGFLANWNVPAPPPQPDPFFRSNPFAQIRRPDLLPIDLLGDLHLFEEGRWNPVTFSSRIPAEIGQVQVFVPSLEEQRSLLLRFGRPKDLVRAEQVETALKR
ncbi:hypothetical protein [Hoeflea poritis]|uniref:Amino acid transporter n=1 Tax=Hoeflea poritis TaxID=2993659 RepID=A0ABT4VQV6_9HYPH|nr:hypothetical protein [Hoeflea poritis]MDA4847090.1 hypothetical protein [Hoeflea poritis]